MTALHVCVVAPTASSIIPGSTAEMAGGAELQLIHLGKAFARRRARVSFVVGDYGQPERGLIDNVSVVRCPFRYYGNSWRYYPADTWRLIRLVRRLKPDVLLLKTPRTLTLPLVMARVGLETRVVRIMASDSDCDASFFPLSNMLYLLGAPLVNGTVFQSSAQAALAERSLGLRGRVIPNIAHGDPASGSMMPRDIDCLWVGTCTRNKDPEAFLAVARKLPDVGFTMIMAPSSDTALNARVVSQASALGNVDYQGFVPYEKTRGFFERSRLIVHTSHREGFPNVFLQAWECGTPIVSMHVDPDGVIEKNRLGKVSRNVPSMIQHIRELLHNDRDRATISEACVAYLGLNHSPGVVIDKYLDYFTELGVRRAADVPRAWTQV